MNKKVNSHITILSYWVPIYCWVNRHVLWTKSLSKEIPHVTNSGIYYQHAGNIASRTTTEILQPLSNSFKDQNITTEVFTNRGSPFTSLSMCPLILLGMLNDHEWPVLTNVDLGDIFAHGLFWRLEMHLVFTGSLLVRLLCIRLYDRKQNSTKQVWLPDPAWQIIVQLSDICMT